MPHEGKVRSWLRRCRVPPEDIDDLIQESYCSLAAHDGHERIDRPAAYFFSIARNLLLKRQRGHTVVPLASASDLDTIEDLAPSPERETSARLEFARVDALIAALGEPCATVVRMRRIEGRSQREIAAELGISEGMVEWHVHRGIKAVLARMRGDARIVDEMIDDSARREQIA
jgi:RNA polymerase sigma-70 factor (ECF subfamily)